MDYDDDSLTRCGLVTFFARSSKNTALESCMITQLTRPVTNTLTHWGIYMADFDQSFINEVFRRLKVNSGSSLDFSHGQLSRTALYVIRQYGADWAPSVSPYQDSTEQRRFRRKLRMLIEQAVSVQGKSTKGVWCRFRLHAINKYSRLESKKIILRISSSL